MVSWLRRPNGNGDGSQNGVRVSSALVPVTGASCDEEIVRLACELLESPRSRIHILYVIEVGRDSPVDADIESVDQRGERILRRMEEIAASYKCDLEAQIVQARKAGAAVVREAVDREVDAIIMGTPYRETYGSYSLGDQIPYVLKHAPCKVIVSRDPMGLAPGVSRFGSGPRVS